MLLCGNARVCLFASYPVTVSIEMPAIAALAPKYRCWSGHSGRSAIGIIVPRARWQSGLRRAGATAMTVSAAIFAIIMTTVGRRPASMRFRVTNGDYRERQYPDYSVENRHPEIVGRKGQISMNLISRNRHRNGFEAKRDVAGNIRSKSWWRGDRPLLALRDFCGRRSPGSTLLRKNGAEYPTRTDDLPLTRRLLYQLS